MNTTEFDAALEAELTPVQEDFDALLDAEINRPDEKFDALLDSEMKQVVDSEETTTKIKSVMSGYDRFQANTKTIQDISTTSNGAMPREDVNRYLQNADAKTLQLEADLPNLIRRDKAVAKFAGESKENLEILKNNYIPLQQLSAKAKSIANGSAISNTEKIFNQNIANITAVYNAVSFLSNNRSLEEFASTANVLNKKKKDNQITGPAVEKFEKFWKDDEAGFTDFVKMVWEDPNTAVAAFQEAATAASSVGASIAGGVAGATAGAAAGPVGAAKGAALGAATLNGLAEFGGYVSQELEENYTLPNGEIDLDKLRADKNFVNRMRFEASAKGISTAVVELFIGKAVGGLGGKVVKFVKPEPLKAIVNSRVAKAAGSAVSEFAEEAGGSITTETGMDAYKGRLTPKKFAQNVTQGVREGLSGAILGGASSAAGAAYSSTRSGVTNLLSDKGKAEQAFTDSEKADKAKAFTKSIYEVQNQIDQLNLSPDKAEELLSQSMQNEIMSDLSANSQEGLDTDENNQVLIQLDMLEAEAVLGQKTEDFINSLPYEIQDQARKNLDEGGFTEIPANIFVARTMQYPAIVPLGVHPELDIHAHQAEEIHQRLEKEIETLMAPKAESARKRLEGEQIARTVLEPMAGVTIQISDENTLVINNNGESQTLNLYQEESAEEYAQVSDALVKGVLKRMPNILSENPVFIENLTGIATRTLIKRAKVLGVSASDLTDSLVINYTDPLAYIAYTRNTIPSLPSNIKTQRYNIGSTTNTLTVFHEIAHYVLNGMAEDKAYLLGLTEINEEQADYLEVIKATEVFLGVDDIISAIEFPSQEVVVRHPNPNYNDKGKLNKEGLVVRNQSGDRLNLRTITHEKFATTMERFVLTGELPAESSEEFAKIFLYTKNTFERDTVHLTSPELSNVAVEYTNAVAPNEQVAKVFGSVYNVAEDFLTRVTKLFNFPQLPVQLLGAKGPEIIQKLSSVKYKLIAQEFVKFYNNQTKVRNAIQGLMLKRLTDEEIRGAIVLSEAPTVNKVLDLIDLGLIGKIRKTDLKANGASDYLKVVLDQFTEDRADTRLDDVASMLGVTDAELLVALSSEANDISKKVLGDIRDTVFKSDPTLKNDQQIKEEFEKGIARALPTLLKRQLKDITSQYPVQIREFLAVMNRQAPQLRGSYGKMLKAKALNTILSMNARQVTFTRLMNKVKQANASVISAFTSGRLEASLQAKEEEVLASYVLNQGVKLKPKLDKAIANIRDFSKATTVTSETNEAPEIVNHIRRVIFAMAQGKKVEDFIPVTQQKFDEMVSDAKDASPELDVQDIEQALRSKVTFVESNTFSSMSRGEVDFLNNQVRNLFANVDAVGPAAVSSLLMTDELVKRGRFFAKRVRENELAIRAGERAIVAQSLISDLEKVQRVLDLRAWGPFQFRDIHAVFRTMYKTDEEYIASPIYGYIETIINKEAELTSEKAEINQKLYDAFAIPFKSNIGFIKGLLGKYSLDEYPSEYSKPIKAINMNFTFENKGELLTALLLAGSESGRDKFLLSNGIINTSDFSGLSGDEKAMFADFDIFYNQGILTDEDLLAVNKVWEVMAELYPKIKEVHRRQRGISVGKIEASKFRVGPIEMTGGYYPVGYKQSSKLEMSDEVDKQVKFLNSFYGLYRLMPANMTKTRADSIGPTPVNLSLNKISSYIDVALRTYYLEEALDNFASVMNDDQVELLLKEKRIGALAPRRTDRKGRTHETGIINSFINTVRNQSVIDTSDASAFSRFATANLPMIQYAVGLTSSIVNYTSGLVPLFTQINPRLVLQEALIGAATLGNVGVDPSAKSKYMRSREAQFVRFFIDSENSIEQVYNSYDQIQEKYVKPFSFFLMKNSQRVLEVVAWRASYNDALSKGKTEAEAVRSADFNVRAVVSGYEASAASQAQIGGYYVKLVNMASLHLYSGRRQMFAAYNREGNRVLRNLSAFATGIAIAGMTGFLDNAVRKALTASSKLYVPEEEEEELARLATLSSFLGYATGPYGRLLDFASPYTPSANPLVSAINSSRVGLKAIYNGALWAPYPMTPAEKKGILTGASFLTGIPFTSASKMGDILNLLKSDAELYSEEYERNAIRIPYKRMEKMKKGF